MLVLDTSAAVDIVRETEKGIALALLMEEAGESVLACDLFRAEVRNALWKYARAHIVTRQEALDCIDDACGLVDEFVPIEELGDEAFAEALRLNHSVYDMLYLCLARRRGATLLTLDKRLAALCHEAGVNCVEEVELPPLA